MNVRNTLPMNRRQFVAAAGGALAALGLASGDGAFGAARGAGLQSATTSDRADVALVFCDEAGLSGKRRMLVETVITRACPRIKFEAVVIRDAQQARDVVNRTAGVDGYLVWVFGGAGGAAQVFARSGRPVVVAVDRPAPV